MITYSWLKGVFGTKDHRQHFEAAVNPLNSFETDAIQSLDKF